MDFIKFAYRGTMRGYDGVLFDVDWVIVPETNSHIEIPTPFRSGYNDAYYPFDLGFVGEIPNRNPQRSRLKLPKRVCPDCRLGTDDWWTNGWPNGTPPVVLEADGFAVGCGPGPRKARGKARGHAFAFGYPAATVSHVGSAPGEAFAEAFAEWTAAATGEAPASSEAPGYPHGTVVGTGSAPGSSSASAYNPDVFGCSDPAVGYPFVWLVDLHAASISAGTCTTAGLCAALNTTYAVEWQSGCHWILLGWTEPCGFSDSLYLDHNPGDPVWYLTFGFAAQYALNTDSEPWHPTAPNTLHLIFASPNCANWPADITIYPIRA